MATDSDCEPTEKDELLVLRQRVAALEKELAEHRANQAPWKNYRIAVEATSEGVAFISNEGIYTYMNRAHAELHGYEHPDQMLEMSWSCRLSARSIQDGRNK